MEENDISAIIDINLYEILGVSENDNFDIIKKEYKKLALKYHPDKSINNEDKFELVTLAYSILSNYQYRKIYDRLRDNVSKDFEILKTEDREKEILPQQYNKSYDVVNQDLDKQHGYTENNLINKKDIGKLFNETLNNRRTLENDLKKSVKINIKEHFDNLDRKIDKLEIVPYNDSVIVLNSVKNYGKLYDTGPSIFERTFELPQITKYIDDGLKPQDRLIKYKLDNNIKL